MASAEELERLFYLVMEDPSQVDEQELAAALKGAVRLHIYLPEPPVDSSISAPYMKAFLQIQSEINRLAAQARSGDSKATKLTNALKRELEIHVEVKGGSSSLNLDLTEVLKKAMGQMTGKQVLGAVLGSGLILSTAWGAGAWMESQKEVQLAQLRSEDHRAALDALSFATQQDMDRYERLIGVMVEQVDLGREIVDLLDTSYRETVRAAVSSDVTQINGQEITGDEASLLTLSGKTQTESIQETVEARVIDINTEDLLSPTVEMQNIDTLAKFKFTILNDLFADEQRSALFEALEDGRTVLVTVEHSMGDGEVRSTKFVALAERPDAG